MLDSPKNGSSHSYACIILGALHPWLGAQAILGLCIFVGPLSQTADAGIINGPVSIDEIACIFALQMIKYI